MEVFNIRLALFTSARSVQNYMRRSAEFCLLSLRYAARWTIRFNCSSNIGIGLSRQWVSERVSESCQGGWRLSMRLLFCVCIFLSLFPGLSATWALFADKIVLTCVLPDCVSRGAKVCDEDNRVNIQREWAILFVDGSRWEKWRLGWNGISDHQVKI